VGVRRVMATLVICSRNAEVHAPRADSGQMLGFLFVGSVQDKNIYFTTWSCYFSTPYRLLQNHGMSAGKQDDDNGGSPPNRPFFSGFSLSLLSPDSSDWEGTKLELLSPARQERACSCHYCPSHLELMMSLEGSEPVPPKFLSSVHSRL